MESREVPLSRRENREKGVLTEVLKFIVPGLNALEIAAILLKLQERSHRNSERSDKKFLHFCTRLHRQSSSSVLTFQLLSLKAV
jgi:hypothetical protein